jgi:predicted ATPase
MIKKYVIDGCRGAGKTTLLFGTSPGTESSTYPNLQSLGFECISESIHTVITDMIRQDKSSQDNLPLIFENTLKLDRQKYLNLSQESNENKIYFFDRCFYSWTEVMKRKNISLPLWYNQLNSELQFSNPIFILEPIQSFDLTTNNYKIRSCTLEKRQKEYADTKQMYFNLGYDVVEVPVFAEQNAAENNKRRIDLILKHINR